MQNGTHCDGQRITLFKTPQTVTGKQARDGLFISRHNIGYGSHYNEALHYHDFYEIELVCEGEAVHRLNRQEIRVSRGYVTLLRKNDYHAYHFKGKETLKLYSICFEEKHISAALGKRLLELKGSCDCFLEAEEYNRVITLTEILYDAFIHPDFNYNNTVRSCLELIVTVIIGQLPDCGDENDISYHLRNALLYIEKNFEKTDLSLSEVAAELGISENYLGRLFSHELNTSYTYYVRNRRLTHSLRYLVQSNVAVSEIARLCGFGSDAYYISVFKQKYGITPKQYIKNFNE